MNIYILFYRDFDLKIKTNKILVKLAIIIFLYKIKFHLTVVINNSIFFFF